MQVLVTRPEGQQQPLCDSLQALGLQVDHVPLLDIEPLPIGPVEKQQALDLDQFAGVIVISPTAARLAMDVLENYWPMWPVKQHWFCPGAGTAKVLRQHDLDAVYPQSGNTSEDLLQNPLLQTLEHQSWLILKGEGGRDLLADELTRRGARVVEWPLYRRVDRQHLSEEEQRKLQNANLILVSSSQVLDNLNQLADDRVLQQATLMVTSGRLQAQAKQSGWQHLALAAGASDTHLVDAVQRWLG